MECCVMAPSAALKRKVLSTTRGASRHCTSSAPTILRTCAHRTDLVSEMVGVLLTALSGGGDRDPPESASPGNRVQKVTSHE